MRYASLLLAVLFSAGLFAQLPNGSTAPNFTATDINGQSHTLYADYLDQDKVVFLDFFATWCPPCWNYHQSHAFENLYQSYGPPGTNEVMTFSIEADPTTTLNDILGTGSNTIGNWTAGISYPIIDNSALGNLYAINYYPTIYGICPDRTITVVGQVGTAALYNFAQACPPLPPQVSVTNVTNVNCFGQATGAISIAVNGGISPYTFQWNNGTTTQNLTNIPAGTYAVTVTGANGGTADLGPILISQPTSALSLSLLSVTHAGCNGMAGSASVLATGGTGTPAYVWSNGQVGPTATGLLPGTYGVTATDANGCMEVIPAIVIQPPAIPTADAGDDASLDCLNATAILDGSQSSIGPNIQYFWTTTNGHIVSGENELTAEVDAPGTYTLKVVNTATSCSMTDDVEVTEDTTPPNADAGDDMVLNCAMTQVTLSGSGSTGNSFVYAWTTTNGNIISGANTSTPEVDAAGDYFLTITNQNNGCTASDTTSVSEDFTPPDAQALGGILDCNQTSLFLDGSSSATNAIFEWTGPGNFFSQEEDPLVDQSGVYSLTVTAENGCTASAQTEVLEDTTPPGATADGGTLTCSVASVMLSAQSNDPQAVFEWTGPGGFSSSDASPEVDLAGIYELVATGQNGCTSSDQAEVLEDTDPPFADAGAPQTLNCHHATVILDGSNSASGTGLSFLWTTPDGNIVNGAQTLTPEVDSGGNYFLTITNQNNGCTGESMTSVTYHAPVSVQTDTLVNVLCHGGNTGMAAASATGGDGQYLFAWSTGDSTAVINELFAGTYFLTVTDGENCSAMDTFLIAQPPQLEPGLVTTNESAFMANDGNIDAFPSGGTPPYTFLWSNGDTAASIGPLAPGNYALTLTDAHNCETFASTTVNSFQCQISGDISVQNITCHGQSDGSLTLQIQQAAPPVSFLWSNGDTTQTLTGLPPGAYSVTATDADQCPISRSVTLTEPAPLLLNLTVSGETAAQANDGAASVLPSGGTPPWSVLWSTGDTSLTVTGLSPGLYSTTLTDAMNCQESQTFEVLAFGCDLMVSADTTHISCFGANDGAAAVQVSGGTTPYIYVWSNGSNSASQSGLAPGNYSVTITDADNCSIEKNFTIVESEALAIQQDTILHADCEDHSNGMAAVSATGGTGNIEFVWSNGQTGSVADQLAPGIYSVIASDENQCSDSLEIEIEVQDNEPPIVLTQNIHRTLNDDGIVFLSPDEVDGGSFDNCGIESMSLDITGFDCDNIGTQPVTLTVVDVHGNIGSAVAMVEILDNIPPVVGANDLTVQLDANGLANISVGQIENGSFDNCGIESFLLDKTTFTCDHLGENEVILSVFDVNENVGTKTVTVTVEDKIPPVAVAKDLTLDLGTGSFVALTPQMVDNGSFDNCAIVEKMISPDTLNCSNVGSNIVMLTLRDAAGNTASALANVTLTNSVPPVLGCPGDLVADSCTSVVHFPTPVVMDHCEGGTLNQIQGLPSGASFPPGSTLNVFEYVSLSGDTAQCAFSVTVPMDFVFIEGEITPVSCAGAHDGAIEVMVLGGSGNFTFLWNTGDTLQSIYGIPAGTYFLEVFDENGCSTAVTFEVPEPEPIGLIIENIVHDANMTSTGAIDITPTGGSGMYLFTWFDAGGNVISTSEDPAGLAAGFYQVQILDSENCGFQSDFIEIESVTATNEPEPGSNIQLWPNPAGEKAWLRVPKNETVVGILVWSPKKGLVPVTVTAVHDHQWEIETGQLLRGIYWIQIDTSGGRFYKKLIIL